jgi:hypothetical protein
MSKTTKVSVPKDSGDEITLTIAGGEPTRYKVTDGHVTVPNENLDTFLSAVPGSSQVTESTESKGA